MIGGLSCVVVVVVGVLGVAAVLVGVLVAADW